MYVFFFKYVKIIRKSPECQNILNINHDDEWKYSFLYNYPSIFLLSTSKCCLQEPVRDLSLSLGSLESLLWHYCFRNRMFFCFFLLRLDVVLASCATSPSSFFYRQIQPLEDLLLIGRSHCCSHRFPWLMMQLKLNKPGSSRRRISRIIKFHAISLLLLLLFMRDLAGNGPSSCLVSKMLSL